MKVGIGFDNLAQPYAAGKSVAQKALENGGIGRCDLVLAFCSGQFDNESFFRGMQSVVGQRVPIIGGSAPGIITNAHLSYEGYPAGAAVFESDALAVSVVSEDLRDCAERPAGRRLAETLSRSGAEGHLLVFYDSIRIPALGDSPPILNVSAPLIAGIEEGLEPGIALIGAGLIGDFSLSRASVFCGDSVRREQVVAARVAGTFAPYFRIMHGCTPLDGVYRRITRLEGAVVHEIDGRPAAELIDEIYGHKRWRQQHPVNLLTIGTHYGQRFSAPDEGRYVNRLITGVIPDGNSISLFEPDLIEGMEIQFMLRDSAAMIQSARQNAQALVQQIKSRGQRPIFGFYIDCAGRSALVSNTTTEEAAEVQQVMNQSQIPFLGFYSGVEIAPFIEKSRGLDWTGVLMILAQSEFHER
jgi:hypothetical protein